MKKKDMNEKMKEGFSEVEKFTHRHLVETMTAVAILVGAFSGWMHFFLGTMGWSLLFLAIGAILGLFAPSQMDAFMMKAYAFSKGPKRGVVIAAETVKILIALFLPFVYFGFVGVMAGTAMQYYIQSPTTHK